MTVFVYSENREKMTEPYLIESRGNEMKSELAKTIKDESESTNSNKIVWIRIIVAYILILSFTLFSIGALCFGLGLIKRTSGPLTCSPDLNNILLRIEELERKAQLYERYVPINHELENVKYMDYSSNGRPRSKRQIDRQLIEDGVPIEFDRGKNETRSTEGFRIYDSWYQKSNSIPISRNGRNMNGGSSDNEAIRPHHRKSASWVEEKRKRRKRKKHNLNAHFDDNSIYRKGRQGRKRTSSSSSRTRQTSREIDQMKYARRSRVSITATESSIPIPVVIPPATTKAPKISNSALVRSLDSGNKRNHFKRRKHIGHGRQLGIHHRVSSSSENSLPMPLPLVENVNIASSPKKMALKSSAFRSIDGSISDKFSGLKSVHFVGKLDSPPVDGNYRNQEVDGKFRHWKLARWGKKMHLENDFPINNGTIQVKQPGIYYIYAQINYLDEHDVNAFQVLLNDDPFLLCTVMTHTGRSHTISKANTCYTGGVTFMEADEEISIRDLEVGRHSVIRPAHTFFGLIQLSGLKP